MAVTVPTYVTRQQLAGALDVAPSAAAARELDRKIVEATAAVDQLCRRTFVPTTDTRSFDWPAPGHSSPSYRLWLDDDELISLTSVTAGGVAVSTGDVLLEPVNEGPPYDRLDLNMGTSTFWTIDDTWQRSIVVTGLWGGSSDAREAVGTLSEALDTSETDIDVSAATAAAAGVGDVLVVDSERMLVTGWSWATTGETASLTASMADRSITVADIGTYADGETLLIGGERILVVDRAGTTLTVDRAQGGTTLVAHTTATLFGARTLRVVRGSSGSTAASHSTGATIERQLYPALVSQLAFAEATVGWLQGRGGYSRSTQGAGESSRKAPTGTLEDLRDQCARAHRRYRWATV